MQLSLQSQLTRQPSCIPPIDKWTLVNVPEMVTRMAYKGSGKKAQIKGAGGKRSGFSFVPKQSSKPAPKTAKRHTNKSHGTNTRGGGQRSGK